MVASQNDFESLASAFGLILKQLRSEAGISQERLEELSGLDRNFISMLERGVRKPSLETVFRLAQHLDTTPSQFIQAVEKQMSA